MTFSAKSLIFSVLLGLDMGNRCGKVVLRSRGRDPLTPLRRISIDLKDLRLLCVGDAFIARLSRLYGTEISYKRGLGIINP
jgi:hypothetical protein